MNQFLQAICLGPADDLPRLVYCDYLEESGSPDDAVRAEFIRLSIEVARIEAILSSPFPDQSDCTGISASWCPVCGDCSCSDREESMNDAGCPLHETMSRHSGDDSLKSKVDQLKDRCYELSGPHDDPGAYGDNFWKWFEGCLMEVENVEVSRGFVSGIELTLREFYGREIQCLQCVDYAPDYETNAIECRRCDGSGTVWEDGSAKWLFENNPIQEVVLSDRRPVSLREIDGTTRWGFDKQTDGGGYPAALDSRAISLPSEIFDLLPDTEFKHNGYRKWYYSEKRANAYLSAALVRYGRELAGLQKKPACRGRCFGGSMDGRIIEAEYPRYVVPVFCDLSATVATADELVPENAMMKSESYRFSELAGIRGWHYQPDGRSS